MPRASYLRPAPERRAERHRSLEFESADWLRRAFRREQHDRRAHLETCEFGSALGEFQRRAGDVAELLVSESTGVVLATSANDFSVREAKAFLGVLRERGLHVDGVVLNRVDTVLPPLAHDAVLHDAFGDAVDDASLQRAADIYDDAREQADRSRKVRQDLERSYPDLPVCAIERMSPPPTGLQSLAEMGARITRS